MGGPRRKGGAKVGEGTGESGGRGVEALSTMASKG